MLVAVASYHRTIIPLKQEKQEFSSNHYSSLRLVRSCVDGGIVQSETCSRYELWYDDTMTSRHTSSCEFIVPHARQD